MATKTTKAAAAAVAATALAVMLAYSAMVLPASAQTPATQASASNTNTSFSNSALPGQFAGYGAGQALGAGPMREGPGPRQAPQANLTVGQTITVSSTQGKYFVVGDAAHNGTASGTVTFTVTGKLAAGYTLSLTQGSLVVDGTTYTVSSGSAQMDRAANALVGQGATTPSGQFLIRASAHGSFAGTTATMSLDLGAGSTEYLVFLAGTVK